MGHLFDNSVSVVLWVTKLSDFVASVIWKIKITSDMVGVWDVGFRPLQSKRTISKISDPLRSTRNMEFDFTKYNVAYSKTTLDFTERQFFIGS